ncbi:response regulator transcription factor [Profundibacterium mesophilum]|nr:response regulator transcription factor [Profundibacterium mesophilum]
MQILIADDHDLVRETLAAYLVDQGRSEVSVAPDLEKALSTIAKHGPFDVVLLDLEMPGMNGLEGLERARAANKMQPVGIISGTTTRRAADAALAGGASGFLPKTLSARSLLNAIRFMAAGEVFAPVALMAQSEADTAHAFDETLSPRERQVLVGLTNGWANKEIARKLSLREVTVKLHVKTLCRKLSARNRTHAAMIAKDAGYV